MRPAPVRAGRLVPAVFACFAALALLPAVAGAQEAERFNVTAFTSYSLQRYHSIGADTLGLSLERTPESGLDVDFRAVDLPVGKGAKPSLHLLGGVASGTRV